VNLRLSSPHQQYVHLDLFRFNILVPNLQQQAKDAHVGAVKSFSMPPTPKAPAVPADLASELSAYDAAEPTLEAVQTSSSSGSLEEQTGGGADEFLALLEKDVPKPEHHH
jgi:F-type H+-transporting ATPase subunit h